MDVVVVFNGLGNQMSQYAFYLQKKQLNPKTKWIYVKSACPHDGFELERVFKIKRDIGVDILCLRFIYWLSFTKRKPFVFFRLLSRIMKYCGTHIIYEAKNYDFSINNLKGKGTGITYYWGGWHSEKNFIDIQSVVRNIFAFDDFNLDIEDQALMKDICSKESVSIHIRRGDYLTDVDFGGVCDLNYYIRAISYIKERVEHPIFYVFSNDVLWVQENFHMSDMVVVNKNTGKDSWKDMYLMSSCKHNINANSTFSWWGAWLNHNPNKIVIVPEKFIVTRQTKDIYPSNWVKIK